MNLTQWLEQALAQKLLRPLDIQFARMLANENQPTLMLAAALTSRAVGEGHVCLALDKLTAENSFISQHRTLARQLFILAGAPANWREVLLTYVAVSEGTQATPLKLSHQRLYLHRLWCNERSVIDFFHQQNHIIEVDKQRVAVLLNQLFGQQPDIDWQKVAVAVALTRRIAVISGGPGTGKTTTVARLLQATLQLQRTTNRHPLRIRLAAPTGKAAARLSESLVLALQHVKFSEQAHILPDEACTLHRLLGVQQGSQRSRYHAGNPLHLDILVVDEASMIDLPMMARLIAALPEQARLILLGDHDQLASVEAGAVLGDICHYAHFGYSSARAAELSVLTGYTIGGCDSAPLSELRDSLCLLRKSYRFHPDSGIGQLAQAVNAGNTAAIQCILTQDFSDLHQQNLLTTQNYQQMITDALNGYQHYLHALRQYGQHPVEPDSSLQHAIVDTAPQQVRQLLQAFSEYQLLCALREGPYGVSGLNEQLEQAMATRGLICRQPASYWYHGRPVMISRNDSALGLFNGDTGITLQQNGAIRVWFAMSDGKLQSIAPGRLPEHETAWAMTVHKSQGSEFDHAALILPVQSGPLITREMVYTAITRARRRLSLYADSDSLRQAVSRCIDRHSGLLQAIDEAK